MATKFGIIDPIPVAFITPEDREIFEYHSINIQIITGSPDKCLLWSNDFIGYYNHVRGDNHSNISQPSDIVQLRKRLQKIVARSRGAVKYFRVVLTIEPYVFANACKHKNKVSVHMGGECYWITARNIKVWHSYDWFQKRLGKYKEFLEDQM